jgi:hypothetical protein
MVLVENILKIVAFVSFICSSNTSSLSTHTEKHTVSGYIVQVLGVQILIGIKSMCVCVCVCILIFKSGLKI